MFVSVAEQLAKKPRKDLGAYSDFADDVFKLGKAMSPDDTTRYLTLMRRAKRVGAEETLLIGLTLHGSDELCLPIFIPRVNKLRDVGFAGVYEFVGFCYSAQSAEGAMLGYVMRSRHPLAIEAKLAYLMKPRTLPQMRNMAYVSVSSDPDGRRLVSRLRARDGQTFDSAAQPIIREAVSDSQRVINAATDGLLRFLVQEGQLTVELPYGVDPFRFVGMGRKVVLAKLTDRHNVPGPCVSFPNLDRDFGGTKRERSIREPIVWNRERTRAIIRIRGGLDRAWYEVELAKIDGTWWVMMAEMTSVE
jgi:hypothetical protein